MDDSDFDESGSSRPRQGTRQVPCRAAKVKAPARSNRLTRAAAAYVSGSQQSDLEELESGDIITYGKRKLSGAAATTSSKRLRRNPPRRPARNKANPSRKPRPRAPKPSEQCKAKSAPVVVRTKALAGDWGALPYFLWCNVFEHIAAPLHHRNSRVEDARKASRTLLRAARAAKVLTEPALTAVYNSIVLSRISSNLFLQKLATTAPTTLNYRPKIETLLIDVEAISKKLDIKALIRNMPRLQHLEFYHRYDERPYRELDFPIRWKYPQEFFEALEESSAGSHTALRSFKWSSRMAGDSFPLSELKNIHLQPSFSSLRKVAFVNYQLPSLHASSTSSSRARVAEPDEIAAMDEPVVQQMAEAIAALPELEHLVIEASTVANASLLEQLPRNLKHLDLISCWDVESESFSAFLLTHGHSLKTLTLDHCQSLDLGFLPVLGQACPNLEHLSMDFQNFRHHEHYDDSEPSYERLLSEFDKPDWPSSIRSINLQNLGHWDIRGADNFFRSLQNAAPTMPNLRRLELKATLDVPFRRRADFREHWVETLNYIFKRPMEEPVPVPRPRVLPKPPVQKQEPVLNGDNAENMKTPVRRSTRRTRAAEPSPSPPEPDRREHSRMSQLTQEEERLKTTFMKRGYAADDEDSQDELAVTPLSHQMPIIPRFRQLLCQIVDIQIDNQKVRERIFTTEDFIDSSGDEDAEWNGEDEVFD